MRSVGDFDGDRYWVSSNSQLLQYLRKSDLWIERPAPILDSIVELSDGELEEHLFNLFLKTRFQSSMQWAWKPIVGWPSWTVI